MRCRLTVWRLRWKLFRIKCKEFYVKYLKILLWAIAEIIAELFLAKNRKD